MECIQYLANLALHRMDRICLNDLNRRTDLVFSQAEPIVITCSNGKQLRLIHVFHGFTQLLINAIGHIVFNSANPQIKIKVRLQKAAFSGRT